MNWAGCKSVLVALAILVATVAAAYAQSDENVDALNAKVEELYKVGKYVEAVPIAQYAVALAELQSGPDYPIVAQSLEKLAVLYHRQGRYADAEPLHRRSLAIRERALGPDHPDVGTTLNNFAVVLHSQVGMMTPSRYSGALSVSAKERWALTTRMSGRPSTTWPSFTRLWAATPRLSSPTGGRSRSGKRCWVQSTQVLASR